MLAVSSSISTLQNQIDTVLDANDPDRRYDRGLACVRQGNDDQALADFSEAIRADLEYGEAYYQRALVWRRRGENELALADLDEAIAIDPEHAAAHQHRGIIYQYLGNDEQAEADLAQARTLGYVP